MIYHSNPNHCGCSSLSRCSEMHFWCSTVTCRILSEVLGGAAKGTSSPQGEFKWLPPQRLIQPWFSLSYEFEKWLLTECLSSHFSIASTCEAAHNGERLGFVPQVKHFSFCLQTQTGNLMCENLLTQVYFWSSDLVISCQAICAT